MATYPKGVSYLFPRVMNRNRYIRCPVTFLVGKLLGDFLASSLLKLITGTVGDLLVGAAHLGGVNLSASELALGRVEGLVQVILLASRTAGAGVGLLVAATSKLRSETRKLIHID